MSSSKEQLQAIFNQVMQLASTSLVGVDIGAGFIKVCELTKSGMKGVAIKGFGMAPIPEGAVLDGEVHNEEDVIAALREALKNAKIRSKNICFGIGGPDCVVRKMSAPHGSDQEIMDHITWESEQYIPFGIDNAEVSVHIMKKTAAEIRDVIMAAARLDSCEYYVDFFKESGFNLKIIDMQLLALINIFEHNYSDVMAEFREGTLLVDFGSQYTKLVVYKNGIPLLTKWLQIGGITVTEELQKEIGLSYSEAENLKCSRDEEGNYPEEVLETIKVVVTKMVMAISDAVNIYTHSSSTDRLHRCLVSGGSLQLPGVMEALSEVLSIPVEPLDPLRKIDIKMKQMPVGLEEQLPYVAPIAMGLALRNFEK